MGSHLVPALIIFLIQSRTTAVGHCGPRGEASPKPPNAVYLNVPSNTLEGKGWITVRNVSDVSKEHEIGYIL